jgi:isocitrate dehydrogenase (NAD+)
MSVHDAVLIPGDGIGPEVAAAARRVLAAAGVEIRWQVFEAGVKAQQAGLDPLPAALLTAVRETGAALKGPLTTPVASGFTSVNVGLRRSLDLYANLRPVRSLPGVASRWGEVDLVIIRENTEGLYIGEERWEDDDTVEAVRRISRAGSQRIAEFAFQTAAELGKRSVTAVHKANILKESDGLFLETARQTASRYPEIEFKDRIVDALCLDLTLDPNRHEVLLCPNLYGDIASDLAAGLVGGLGLVPGANLGADCAVFEAVHGSAPDIAGQGIANPTALILAGAMLLRRLGEGAAAGRVERGLRELYAGGTTLPPDAGGTASTREFTDALIDAVQSFRT